jgi:hypothetical protein
MGRSPWVQDLMRYGLIAGDWTEGQVKTIANMFMPNQMGAHTRSSIPKGLGSYMAGIEGLNILLNGHPTWENGPGNEFKLEVTGALNGAAYLSGNPDIGSIDPTDKTPTRTFVDPMPPLRWMMETIHEAAREGVYTMGQAEQAMGNQAAGQRLMDFTGTNLEKGELPPNLCGKIGQDIEQRIGPGPSALGAAKEFFTKQQTDWTGTPLDPVDLSTPTGWATWAGHLVAPFAPATATSVLSNVDVAHPSWRTYGGDAFTEFLGFTRVNRDKEVSRNLSAVDKVKTQFLGIDPAIIKEDEEDHQQRIAVNDQKRADLFTALPDDTNMTHGDADKKLHSYNDERKADTRRQEIFNDFASKVPEGPLRDAIQRMFENAWNVPPSPSIPQGEGISGLVEHMWNPSSSPTPADLNPTTDIAELANAYWTPPVWM